ncbi:MAG TPA: FliM/FliN family flagellar motor switch protein [Edaphobacter sp.]
MTDKDLVRVETEIEERGMVAVPAVAPDASDAMKQPGVMEIERHVAWPMLSRLSMPVSAEIPVANFKVRNLLALEAGQLVQSAWSETEDVRIVAAGVQAGWSEFEVEEQKLLVRLTRLA